MSEYRSLLTLLSKISIDELRETFALNADRLTLPQFLGILTTNSSHVRRNSLDIEDVAVQAVDLFKVMAVRGDGLLRWEDLSSFIMQMELTAVTKVSADEDIQKSKRYKSSKVDPIHLASDRKIRLLQYIPQPVDKIAVVYQNSEVVNLQVPPTFDGELPRTSSLLRHHTAYRPHQVLAVLQIAETDTVVTSSTQGVTGPHYLTVWDLPTDDDRNSGGQYLPTILNQFEITDAAPQDVLHWSSRMQMLFSASRHTGQLFGWSLEHGTRKVLARLHDTGIVGLVEVRRLSTPTNFLISGGVDGNLCYWSMAGALGMDNPSHMHNHDHEPQPHDFVVNTSRHVNAHEHGVHCMAYAQVQCLLFSVGRFRSKERHTSDVLVWNCEEDGRARILRPHTTKSLTGHAGQVGAVLVVPEAEHVITCDSVGDMRVWSLHDLSCTQLFHSAQRLTPPVVTTMCIASCPPTKNRSSVLVSAFEKFEVFQFKPPVVLDAMVGAQFNAAFDTFVTASATQVCVWDARSGHLKVRHDAAKLCERPGAELSKFCIDGGGRKLVVGDDQGSVVVCNLLTGTPIKQLDPHPRGQVTFLKYFDAINCVGSAALGGSVSICDEAPAEGYRATSNKGVASNSVKLRDIVFPGARADPNLNTTSTTSSLGGSPQSTYKAGRQRGETVDVFAGAVDLHLNMLAVCSSSAAGTSLHLWDQEMYSHVGPCEPTAPAGMIKTMREAGAVRGAAFEYVAALSQSDTSITCCEFLSPCGALAGGSSARAVHLWSVPVRESLCLFVAPPFGGQHSGLITSKSAPLKFSQDEPAITALCWGAGAGLENDPLFSLPTAHNTPSASRQTSPRTLFERGNATETSSRLDAATKLASDTQALSQQGRNSSSFLFAADHTGVVLVWLLKPSDLIALGCRPVKPQRRKGYNQFRVMHTDAEPATFKPFQPDPIFPPSSPPRGDASVASDRMSVDGAATMPVNVFPSRMQSPGMTPGSSGHGLGGRSGFGSPNALRGMFNATTSPSLSRAVTLPPSLAGSQTASPRGASASFRRSTLDAPFSARVLALGQANLRVRPCLLQWQAHDAVITSLSWIPSSEMLLSASEDGSAKLFRILTNGPNEAVPELMGRLNVNDPCPTADRWHFQCEAAQDNDIEARRDQAKAVLAQARMHTVNTDKTRPSSPPPPQAGARAASSPLAPAAAPARPTQSVAPLRRSRTQIGTNPCPNPNAPSSGDTGDAMSYLTGPVGDGNSPQSTAHAHAPSSTPGQQNEAASSRLRPSTAGVARRSHCGVGGGGGGGSDKSQNEWDGMLQHVKVFSDALHRSANSAAAKAPAYDLKHSLTNRPVPADPHRRPVTTSTIKPTWVDTMVFPSSDLNRSMTAPPPPRYRPTTTQAPHGSRGRPKPQRSRRTQRSAFASDVSAKGIDATSLLLHELGPEASNDVMKTLSFFPEAADMLVGGATTVRRAGAKSDFKGSVGFRSAPFQNGTPSTAGGGASRGSRNLSNNPRPRSSPHLKRINKLRHMGL